MIEATFFLLFGLFCLYSLFDFFYVGANAWVYSAQSNLRDEDATPEDVTIQIPIYNSGRRIYPLLNSIRDSGISCLTQFLDSSNDDTTKIIEDFLGPVDIEDFPEYQIRKWGSIHLIHFKQKCGNKAWALNQGMHRVNTDFIAVFDSDWEIEAGFLSKLLPIIKNDEQIAYVQACWQSSNESENLISYIDSVSIETEHLVEDVVKDCFGVPFTIHGSAFIIRASLAKQLGWRDKYLSEDVDMMLRIILSGFRGVYIKEQRCKGRTCTSLSEFAAQKSRWIEGRSQVLRSFLGTLLRTDQLSMLKKTLVLHFLVYFLKFPLFLILLVMSILMGESYLILSLALLLANIFTRSLMNLRTISMKKQKIYIASFLEPLVFWMFCIPFSYRALRGTLFKTSRW